MQLLCLQDDKSHVLLVLKICHILQNTYCRAILLYLCNVACLNQNNNINIQESPAIADKPVRRESMPKIAQIRRAYNVIADNTGLSSFV